MKTKFNKFLLTLFTLLLLAIPTATHGATLGWNANPEPDISTYRVYESTNGATGTFSLLASTPNTQYPLLIAGTNINYAWYVTAVNSSGLESAPSSTVSWWSPTIPPPVNILGRTFDSYSASQRQWTNYKVSWTPSDTKFEVTKYVLHRSNPLTGTVTFDAGTNTSYTFPLLPLADYSFMVVAHNAAGASQPGTTYGQSSRPPGNPTGVLRRP